MLVWMKPSGSKQKLRKNHRELSNPSVFSPPTPCFPNSRFASREIHPLGQGTTMMSTYPMGACCYGEFKTIYGDTTQEIKGFVQHWFLLLFLGILLPYHYNVILSRAMTKLYHLCIP